MRKRKMPADDPVILTEEEQAQCRQNAFSWCQIHQDLFAAMKIPFWDTALPE